MYDIEKIGSEIEQLREELVDLIIKNQDLTDLQVVNLSRKLDSLLNTYNKFGAMINEIS